MYNLLPSALIPILVRYCAVIIEQPGAQNSTHNNVVGSPDTVVQTRSARDVHVKVSHERRGLWAVVAVVAMLIVALVVVVLFHGEAGQQTLTPVPERDGQMVAAVAEQSPVACRSGWVVNSPGDKAVPYSRTVPPAGGTVSSGGQVTVTVQGLSKTSVVIQEIRVQVLGRAPLSDALYLPLGCQEGVVPRLYSVDLDADEPVMSVEQGTTPGPYRVDETEPEQFVITPAVETGLVDWQLIIKWTSGDKKGELVVDDSGKPFRTASVTGLRTFCPDLQNRVWVPSC
ncbi:hypothetical protein ACTG9Q_28710 [Actinokineospora sp. 24-640]